MRCKARRGLTFISRIAKDRRSHRRAPEMTSALLCAPSVSDASGLDGHSQRLLEWIDTIRRLDEALQEFDCKPELGVLGDAPAMNRPISQDLELSDFALSAWMQT